MVSYLPFTVSTHCERKLTQSEESDKKSVIKACVLHRHLPQHLMTKNNNVHNKYV